MLDPTKGDIYSVNASFKLDDRQRSVLTAFVQQEGWDVMQKLMESEIREFNVALHNTPVSQREAVLANHNVAVAAAQFYVGLISRIANELGVHSYHTSGVGTVGKPENHNIEDFN